MSRRPIASADLVGSLVWIVLGAAVFHGAWTMDRLEAQHINPYTAPGLVPGVLGLGLVLLGGILLLRSLRGAGSAGGDDAAPPLITPRLLVALALCLTYAIGLVGRGLPFWLSTVLFVFVSIAVFQWSERRARGQIGRGLAVAALCAIGLAVGVTLVFQELFLVRLP